MSADTCVRDVALFPIRTERRTGSTSSHVLIRLTADSGVQGWGELSDLDHYRMFMPAVDAIGAGVRRAVIGFDAGNVVSLGRRLRSMLPDFCHGAATYPPFTLPSQLAAAVEMACLDLVGRASGQSIGELLGGSLRDTIPVAYPLFSAGPTDQHDRFGAVEYAMGTGVSVFRYYVSDDLDVSRRFLHDLVDRFGPTISLKGLDFGSRFHWKAALRFLRSLDGLPIGLVESASWREDYAGMALLRRAIDVDVSEHVSSSSQLLRMIAADAIDVANVTIQSGGIHAARRMLETAQGAGLRCLLGTTQELSPGTSAGAHLAASIDDLAHPADVVGPLLYRDDPVVERVRYVDSELVVPSGPGLGVEIDEAALERLAGNLVDWECPAHGDNYTVR